MPGPTELLVILAIVVVLFGASKIPTLGKGLGEGIRNFKKGLRDDESGESVFIRSHLRMTPLHMTMLIERLQEVAAPGTLDGGFVVTAFGREVRPEDSLRVLFDAGETFVQHPVLWPDTAHA